VTLEEEWEALSATEQPDVGKVASGVDLSLLADDAADCLSVLFMLGALEPEQIGTLRACESELRAALPGLSGPAAVYFQRLADIAGSALMRVGRPGTGFVR
jgi:hypothetical protein